MRNNLVSVAAGVFIIVFATVGCATGAVGAEGLDATDAPAPVHAPADCEGLPCDAVYVDALHGDDAAAGTRDAPKRSIQWGIAVAALQGKVVFVRAGDYHGAVIMESGVDVYGGFDVSWQRGGDATARTLLIGASPAVLFEDLALPTLLDGISVRSLNATAPGASSIGIAISSAQARLRDVNVIAGRGADGRAGAAGAQGTAGGMGGKGKPGCEHSGSPVCGFCLQPTGGLGGASSCGRKGGVGGWPAVGSSSGGSGGNGLVATVGGVGGAYSGNGGSGRHGAAGADGVGGIAGAAIGTFSAWQYVPARGGNGGQGNPGHGGGGGGGGGGGDYLCDSFGSSGGGGGGGGCAGTGGVGGGGGGGSFGIVISEAEVWMDRVSIAAHDGGKGGNGGVAGTGGAGGQGGAGGVYGGSSSQDDAGMGGAGGRGGNGGRGGHGGGGGGGPSVALACLANALLTPHQLVLAAGSGGVGGDAYLGAAAGQSGFVGQSWQCPSF
ncbi:MAG: hypothetical protein IPL79_09000 [Myxococcales bacterium]|nr:hypothetical protein [Myxococcales bacterium]